jgi:hypothetical protein
MTRCNSIDDGMNQCVFNTHSVPLIYKFDYIIFYDTYDTNIVDAPRSSQSLTSKTTVTREPDFQKL